MRKLTRSIVLPSLMLVIFAAPVAAHPNFTGTWKLSIAKSTFGKVPGGQPRSRTDLIQQEEPNVTATLLMENATGRDTALYRYSTDGKPSVNHIGNQVIQSIVRWNGDALVLDSKTRLLIFDMTLHERWTLSSDGKTLTNTRHVKFPLGEGNQTLVFEKQ